MPDFPNPQFYRPYPTRHGPQVHRQYVDSTRYRMLLSFCFPIDALPSGSSEFPSASPPSPSAPCHLPSFPSLSALRRRPGTHLSRSDLLPGLQCVRVLQSGGSESPLTICDLPERISCNTSNRCNWPRSGPGGLAG